MRIDRVTITGIDDSVRASHLIDLRRRWPFAEFGILFSGTQGRPRYPSRDWLMHELPELQGQPLSAHLCGVWVRQFVEQGEFGWGRMYAGVQSLFQRIQLNFHSAFHRQHETFVARLQDLKDAGHAVILQCDGVNDAPVTNLVDQGLGVPLFDVSGGRGLRPTSWPTAWPGVYCGYAGGLGPRHFDAAMSLIASAAGEATIWLDCESNVRSLDDHRLDLSLVEAFLERVAKTMAVATS